MIQIMLTRCPFARLRHPIGVRLCPVSVITSRSIVLGAPQVVIDAEEKSEGDVHAALKAGRYVTSSSILRVHSLYMRISKATEAELVVQSFNDVIVQQRKKGEVLNYLVVRRDFWTCSDFVNQETNDSAGIQTLLFDNYQWNQFLWKEFQQYTEKYFPVSEHTHLVYQEYLQLMRYFHVHKDGVPCGGLLPRNFRLRPPYGVPILSRPMQAPLHLYKTWLHQFTNCLGIKNALVVNAGFGITAALTRRFVKLVRATDANPLAVAALRSDLRSFGPLFNHSVVETAAMFPDSSSTAASMKFDLIVYFPDVPFLNVNDGWCDNRYAPTQKGIQGNLEAFFEKASHHLSAHGVIVIVTTNIFSLAFPDVPHPVELEMKANRRWLLLDYFDSPMEGTFSQESFGSKSNNVVFRTDSLRAEVWAMHRVEDLHVFGWLHGLPGCAPPSNVVGQWNGFSQQNNRLKAIKQRVVDMGGNWGSYRDRLLQLLRDQGNDTEDDVAQAVRMTLDPTYAEELAQKTRSVVEEKLRRERAFHDGAWMKYEEQLCMSPRRAWELEVQRRLGMNFEKSGTQSPPSVPAPIGEETST